MKKQLYICAALSGLLMCAAFNFEYLWPLCFFALIPMLTSLYNNGPGAPGFIFVYMLLYHLPTMLWLYGLYPMTDYGISELWSVVLITLAIISIAAVEGVIFAIAFLPFRRLCAARLPLPAVFIGLYIFAEFLQSHAGWLSFPWCRLGTMVCGFTSFARSASLFGTIFLSAVILSVNALLAGAVMYFRKNEVQRAAVALLLAALVFSADLCLDFIPYPKTEGSLKVAVVQGNLSSINKWKTSVPETIDIYLSLSRQTLGLEPDLILWPETAIPQYPDVAEFHRVISFAESSGITVVTGLYTRDENPAHKYNSIAACYPYGTISEPCRKQKLVPFGEFIPLYEAVERFFPKASHMIAGTGSLPIDISGAKAGGLICYESVFPDIARERAVDSEFFLMCSNDSWFAGSRAKRQHLAQARMRCIENGRWMVRAGNTGISAVIDNLGRVTAAIAPDTADILFSEIDLCTERTLYSVIGDVVALPGILLWIFGALLLVKERIRSRLSGT